METTFDGVTVKLGSTDYVIPPLSLKLIRKYQKDLLKIGRLEGIPGEEELEVIVNVIYDAIKRNYPDLVKDDLEDLIDMKNMKEIFIAIMGASGMEESSASPKV